MQRESCFAIQGHFSSDVGPAKGQGFGGGCGTWGSASHIQNLWWYCWREYKAAAVRRDHGKVCCVIPVLLEAGPLGQWKIDRTTLKIDKKKNKSRLEKMLLTILKYFFCYSF